VLIRDVEVNGRRIDVRVQGALIAELGSRLPRAPHEEVVEGAGGALLPGLHDHHLHLLAMAAAMGSVQLGPPTVRTRDAFARALTDARKATPADSGIRGIGYHESVAGPLDRDQLDAIVSDRPVRVQHRGGALWVLNSAALAAAQLGRETDPDVERDATGRLTGRLWRWDAKLVSPVAPDLRAVGERLARLGITGVTDATPDLDPQALGLLSQAHATGALPQQVVLLGAPLAVALPAGLRTGPYKILLRDHDLPGTDDLTERISAAHGAGRAVAVHCVTRESLLLSLACLATAGVLPGDRIEHGAVVPPELYPLLASEGLRVVTQPAFITSRGDDYLREVDPADRGCLYPYGSLLAAGVQVTPSSDAPFGELDPWRVMACAAARRTEGGQVIGPAESVDPALALNGYLSSPLDPGGPPRQILPGEPADLCLLSAPLEEALRAPDAGFVVLTMCDGVKLFDDTGSP
jgi:predicted amidohydrolase YtcJ